MVAEGSEFVLVWLESVAESGIFTRLGFGLSPPVVLPVNWLKIKKANPARMAKSPDLKIRLPESAVALRAIIGSSVKN